MRVHIGMKPLYSAIKPSARTVFRKQSNDEVYSKPLKQKNLAFSLGQTWEK